MATEPTTLGGALELARGRITMSEARSLLHSVTGHATSYLVAHPEAPLSSANVERFSDLLRRRAAGEPVAYLTGWREFYGRRFCVTRDVLIPRPETELLIDIARTIFTVPPTRVLDLGTGSGVLAATLSLLWPSAQVVAVDQSRAALAVASANARQLEARVGFLGGNWCDALSQTAAFSLIISNPPYVAADDPHLGEGDVRFEPRSALASGTDGLDDIRLIVRHAPLHLAEGGWLLIEHGYDQASAVRALMGRAGLTEPRSWRDLAGIERVSGGLHLSA